MTTGPFRTAAPTIDKARGNATHAEPRGDLDACQTPDGIIHVITSRNAYAFDLARLKAPMPADQHSDSPGSSADRKPMR